MDFDLLKFIIFYCYHVKVNVFTGDFCLLFGYL